MDNLVSIVAVLAASCIVIVLTARLLARAVRRNIGNLTVLDHILRWQLMACLAVFGMAIFDFVNQTAYSFDCYLWEMAALSPVLSVVALMIFVLEDACFMELSQLNGANPKLSSKVLRLVLSNLGASMVLVGPSLALIFRAQVPSAVLVALQIFQAAASFIVFTMVMAFVGYIRLTLEKSTSKALRKAGDKIGSCTRCFSIYGSAAILVRVALLVASQAYRSLLFSSLCSIWMLAVNLGSDIFANIEFDETGFVFFRPTYKIFMSPSKQDNNVSAVGFANCHSLTQTDRGLR
jgi:hypothetical protein